MEEKIENIMQDKNKLKNGTRHGYWEGATWKVNYINGRFAGYMENYNYGYLDYEKRYYAR